MPAQQVWRKRTDQYSRLPEKVPMVFHPHLPQTFSASTQESMAEEVEENNAPEPPEFYRIPKRSIDHTA